MENKEEKFEYYFSQLQKYMLTYKQVELIKDFADHLRSDNLERFQRYRERDPIRKILRILTTVEVDKEKIALFTRYAQTCTANNYSY